MKRIESELELLDEIKRYDRDLEIRTPSYCAGCPHRGTSSVIMDLRKKLSNTEYMQRKHGSGPIDIISHGGIGCYSLNFLPPFRDMHNMAAMGLGGAAGMGAYPFTNNKHYVLCGDSTFFHSEMSTLSNAIKDNQDILYIILDNKNTAMTGHQVTAGSAYDIMGYKTIAQDIESVVRGMDRKGDVFIRRVDPSQRDSYMLLLEDAFLKDGVRVIIADRECGITFHRKKRAAVRDTVRKHGFQPVEKHINITPEVCENCRECTIATGCPGLGITDTPYGEKIGIEASICVDDKYCTRIKACPSFEQVVIRRKKAPVRHTGHQDLWMKDLPHPGLPTLGEKRPTYGIFVPGVGGMGLGFIARLLTAAGAKKKFTVNFYHQKGLAQRNGAVVSHIIFSTGETHVSQRIPNGKADLILGLDYLETVRGLRFSHTSRTVIVCNKAKTPTVKMLMGEDSFPADLESRLKKYSRQERFFGADYFDLSEYYLGNRVYANIMMLGSAYQLGALPLESEVIEDVIRETVVRSERENNIRAFRLGRKLAGDDDMPGSGRNIETIAELISIKTGELKRRSATVAGHFGQRIPDIMRQMDECGEELRKDMVRRYADLLLYENIPYAETYAARVLEVYDRERNSPVTDGPSGDSNSSGAIFPATAAVVWNLAKVMMIKDEVWVAYMLTSPGKLQSDRERYSVDPSRGDRMRYIHINRPKFDVFGFHLEWDMKTRNWMLHLMKRMRFLRRLLPQWHGREKEFRDWYDSKVIGDWLAGAFDRLDTGLAALQLPSDCTGYREIVYPKYEKAQQMFEELSGRTAVKPVSRSAAAQ